MCWFWALSAPSGERRISLSQICYYLAFSSAPWRLRSRLFRALSPGSCSDSVGLGFLWGFLWKPLSPDQLPLIWLDWDLKLCPQRWVAVDVPLASCCVLWNSARAHRASPGWRAVSAPAVPFALTILGPGFRPPAAVEATASRQLCPLPSLVVTGCTCSLRIALAAAQGHRTGSRRFLSRIHNYYQQRFNPGHPNSL